MYSNMSKSITILCTTTSFKNVIEEKIPLKFAIISKIPYNNFLNLELYHIHYTNINYRGLRELKQLQIFRIGRPF